MAEPNYLLGFGERLVRPITLKHGGGEKHYPYTFEEARARLTPQWKEVARDVSALPDAACPGGTSVVSLTLHPAFLARSYYPRHFFEGLGLRSLGSRARPMAPERNRKKALSEKPEPAPEIFGCGSAS